MKNILLGKEITLQMPNGEKRNAQFAIVELSEIIASHDEYTFASSPQYPTTPDGHNINDRNYSGDKQAQAQVAEYAHNLEPERLIVTSRTPAGTPIINKDGFVLSGNNRTMSLKRAVKDYPQNYFAYLKFLFEEYQAFGFKMLMPENEGFYVANAKDPAINIKQPVLVRIDYDIPALNTAELAKYNMDTKKGKRPIDKAIELSSVLRTNPGCRDAIAQILSTYERMSDFYANASDQKKVIDLMTKCSLITEQEKPEYWTPENGITQGGKQFLESVLASIVLKKDALIVSENEGVRDFRRVIVTSLPVLMNNQTLTEGALIDDLNIAVLLQSDMRQSSLPFSSQLAQISAFGDARIYSEKSLYLNRLLDKGQRRFKAAIDRYNNSVNSNAGSSFFETEKLSPSDVFEKVIQVEAMRDNKDSVIEQKAIDNYLKNNGLVESVIPSVSDDKNLHNEIYIQDLLRNATNTDDGKRLKAIKDSLDLIDESDVPKSLLPTLLGGKDYTNRKLKIPTPSVSEPKREKNNIQDKIKIETVVRTKSGFIKDFLIDEIKEKLVSGKKYLSAYSQGEPLFVGTEIQFKNGDWIKDEYIIVDKNYKNIEAEIKTIQARLNKKGLNNTEKELLNKKLKTLRNQFVESKTIQTPVQIFPLLDSEGKRRIDSEALDALEKHLNTLSDTKDLNSKNGVYTPQRVALHEEIIEEMEMGNTCIKRDTPIAIFTGGVPGSGKSTFITKNYNWLNNPNIFKIDADEIRAKLPEYQGWNSQVTHEETGDIVNTLIDYIAPKECRFDVLFDGTFTNMKKYKAMILKTKNLGYDTFAIFMHVDLDTSMSRALSRYQRAGRYVPRSVIIDVNAKGDKVFQELKNELDGWIEVDGLTQKITDKGGKDLPKDRDYGILGNVEDVSTVTDFDFKMKFSALMEFMKSINKIATLYNNHFEKHHSAWLLSEIANNSKIDEKIKELFGKDISTDAILVRANFSYWKWKEFNLNQPFPYEYASQKYEKRFQVAFEFKHNHSIDAPSVPDTKKYKVALESVANPDFMNDSWGVRDQKEKVIKLHYVEVKNLAEAQKAVRQFIADNDLGGGNFPNAKVYDGKKAIANISYNGRIWSNEGTEFFDTPSVSDMQELIEGLKLSMKYLEGNAKTESLTLIQGLEVSLKYL